MFQLSNFVTIECRLLTVCLFMLASGCGATSDSGGTSELSTVNSGQAKPDRGMKKMAVSKNIFFKDEVETNVDVPQGLDGLLFVDTNGNRVQVSDYVGKKRVILVFTEGFAGMLCPFCKTQTARLVANYDKFQALETEVLVVYPGERDHIEEFIEAARTTDKGQVDRVPFPIVLDPKMEAVDYFNIRSKLAHPSTYLIDKNGKVQFAYVGNDMTADRPSIKAMLRTIEAAATRENSGG